jgi:hypothetical protein
MADFLICYFRSDTPGGAARIDDRLSGYFDCGGVELFEGPESNEGIDHGRILDIRKQRQRRRQ